MWIIDAVFENASWARGVQKEIGKGNDDSGRDF